MELFTNLDQFLLLTISLYGNFVYGILFLIIFLETGLVVTPFLPGDSLLFAAGVFAARDFFSLPFLFLTLAAAAILGDAVNYWIGRFFGTTKIVNQSQVEKASEFYATYGARAIILARFVPFLRTFVPFVAGIASMSYAKFTVYNILGGTVWVLLLTSAGYYFGGIPYVQKNLEIIVIAIVAISLFPITIKYLLTKKGELY